MKKMNLLIKSAPLFLVPVFVTSVVSCKTAVDIFEEAKEVDLEFTITPEGKKTNPQKIMQHIYEGIEKGNMRDQQITEYVKSLITWNEEIGEGPKTVFVEFKPNWIKIKEKDCIWYDPDQPNVLNIELTYRLKSRKESVYRQIVWPSQNN